MAVARTGSILTIDAAAQTSSVSLTVPADADGVIIRWTGWRAGTISMSSFTVGGVAISIEDNVPRSGDAAAVGQGWLSSPATGSQTFAWSWNGGGPTEGGRIYVEFVTSGTDAIAVRGSDAAQQTGDTNPGPLSIPSNATDYVSGIGYTFGSFPDLGITGQTVELNDDGPYQNYSAEVATVDSPGASSTTFDMNDGVDFIDFSTIAAMSVYEASAGGSSILPLLNQYHR